MGSAVVTLLKPFKEMGSLAWHNDEAVMLHVCPTTGRFKSNWQRLAGNSKKKKIMLTKCGDNSTFEGCLVPALQIICHIPGTVNDCHFHVIPLFVKRCLLQMWRCDTRFRRSCCTCHTSFDLQNAGSLSVLTQWCCIMTNNYLSHYIF